MDDGPPGVSAAPAEWLRALIAEFLAIEDDELLADRPLGELGIDSLTAAELSTEIEERAGVYVALERFLGEETLAEVARDLGPAQGANGEEAT